MAAYFHGGPEIQQVDGLQTLYLMNPSYVGYSDANGPPQAQQHPNMVFLNSPLNSLNSFPQQNQQESQQQHFVGIPVQHTQQPTTQYNIWAPTPVEVQAHQGLIRPAGLSLSLQSTEDAKISVAGPSSNGLQSVVMGSKYLKAAQQLLDEVVSVGKDGRSEAPPVVAVAEKGEDKSRVKIGKDLEGEGGEGKRGAELSTAERQELQMKKAKLVNMLDEVEQRYRQYHQQMQLIITSFESIAGFNSARTYTSLALQTISKQFRCLRDAITNQIRSTSKSLGEEDFLGGAGGSKSAGSRLRFVDHHLRQQRALQQLGMIQHNAWRPQRGLPERAVSVLRAWLFEHFLHPYPKDSDKHMLAKQTGLTRSQVSNWFINARVRLWKPMVEEMYLEETKEQEQNNDKSETSEHSASKSISQQGHSSTPPSRAEQTENNHNSSDLAIFETHNEESIMQQRLKKARSNESLQHNTIQNQMNMEMKRDELSNRELLMQFMDQGGGFGSYSIGEIGRFDHHEQQFAPRFGGNSVLLTLGLPRGETLSLSGSQQPAYISNESIQMGRRLELSSEEHNCFNINNNNNNGNNPSGSNPPNAYESINIQNRKRFAAQLLPDFVA